MKVFISFLVGVALLWVVAHFVALPWVKTGSGVSIQGNISVNQSTTHGKTSGTSLPSAIPLFKPSNLIQNNTTQNQYSDTYTANAQEATVATYYQQQLSTNHWTITHQSHNNNQYIYDATGNGYSLVVTLTPGSTSATTNMAIEARNQSS